MAQNNDLVFKMLIDAIFLLPYHPYSLNEDVFSFFRIHALQAAMPFDYIHKRYNF